MNRDLEIESYDYSFIWFCIHNDHILGVAFIAARAYFAAFCI